MKSYDSKLIMVGGHSGVGKTSLINALVDYFPTLYSRPISYTSRKKRENEGDNEYIFSNKSTILSMYEKGEFVTLDTIYDNYYAMTKKSIDLLINMNILTIKEIHPSNHNKIKKIYPNSISVLVKNTTSLNENNLRKNDDNNYFNTISDEVFDIVFMYDKNQSVFQNAIDFNRKINSFNKYWTEFPPTGEIDLTNRKGYSILAKHFDDTKRVTTKNFHDLSLAFFENFISSYLTENMKILEVGPGQGWLRRSYQWNKEIDYTSVDISSEMISQNENYKKIISSVRCMPFSSKEFSCVISSLADPYLYPEALCEINRILKDGGLFAFSIPSKMWAENLRKDDINKTTFVIEDGSEVKVFSFTYFKEEICSLAENCGFEIVDISSQNVKELIRANISPAIIISAINAGMALEDLEIIITAILRKGGE